MQSWVNANKLVVNPAKTEYMIFGSQVRISRIVNPISIMLNGHEVKHTKTFKYLGVTLDQTLSWREHIIKMSKRIGSRISLLARSKKYLPTDGLKLLANSLILPLFEYCSNCWSVCNRNVRVILIRQHKKMGRVILGAKTQTPTTDVFRELKWVSIEERWRFRKCKMVFSAINNLTPPYVSNLLTKFGSLHSYRTRNVVNAGLILPKVKTNMGQQSFSFSAPST